MNFKKIILNGCSFTHGCDIIYAKYNIPPFTNFHYATKNWNMSIWDEFNDAQLGGRLKPLLNCDDIVNLAHPGYSNEYIASETINYIERNIENLDLNNTLVLIGWTEFCRTVIYTDSIGPFNYSVPFVDQYLQAFSQENPRTPILEKRIEFLDRIKHLTSIYEEEILASTTDYFRHVNLILMLQFYLKSKNIKYIFWNSLINYPKVTYYKDEHLVRYYQIEDLIDWSKWAPGKNKGSYNYSWQSFMDVDKKYLTASAHPSIEATQMWAELLHKVIKDTYS